MEPGKLGEVVITVIFNHCPPLILCQLHDVAVYSDEECDCGVPSPCARLSGQG